MTSIEMRKKQRDRKKKRRLRVIAAVLVILFLIVQVLLLLGATWRTEEPVYEYHTCNRLWDFVKFCPVEMDRWEYLYEIMELNDMADMTVYPSRVYMVPMYK